MRGAGNASTERGREGPGWVEVTRRSGPGLHNATNTGRLKTHQEVQCVPFKRFSPRELASVNMYVSVCVKEAHVCVPLCSCSTRTRLKSRRSSWPKTPASPSYKSTTGESRWPLALHHQLGLHPPEPLASLPLPSGKTVYVRPPHRKYTHTRTHCNIITCKRAGCSGVIAQVFCG